MFVSHGTLTAEEVATVEANVENTETSLDEGVNIYDTSAVHTLNRRLRAAEVVNVSGSAVIYFTTNGDDPEVEGDNCYVVPAATGASLRVAVGGQSVAVKMISEGTPDYSVSVPGADTGD